MVGVYASFSERVEVMRAMRRMLDHVFHLCDTRLTDVMVIGDFLVYRLSPLWHQGHLTCYYSGPNKMAWTFIEGKHLLKLIFVFPFIVLLVLTTRVFVVAGDLGQSS